MRFTIRDVLWLTVAVSLACAWWAERARADRFQSDSVFLRKAIDKEGFVAEQNCWIGPWLRPKQDSP
jgi:hypothetical protein